MIQDIRLHGQVTNTIEYFAIVAGQNLSHRFFYEIGSPHEAALIRFFSPGNEFIIGKEGIRFKGNGGGFCEYMFGINQPIKDISKKEVVNRLVMYGAVHEPKRDRICFTERMSGTESYEDIFLFGNALSNYYFFVHLPKHHKKVKEQQEYLLKAMGRTLKHTSAVGQEDDRSIIHEMLNGMKVPQAILFLFRIVNMANRTYYESYKQFYRESRGIDPQHQAALEKLAATHQISKYQQERIKIDVIYKYPDNKRIIDQYKDILIELFKNPDQTSSEIARLNRLRTLSVRQNIPVEIFLNLEKLFLKGKKIERIDEPKYLWETREILEGLFLKSQAEEIVVSKEDLMTLLRAKTEALEKRNFGFEALLLEIGKTCDDHCKAKKDTRILEQFGYIITFFDRCDSTYSSLNQIIFMDNAQITAKMLRTIYNNKKIFDNLSAKLFKEIFVDKVLQDRYLTEFGRRKLYVLFLGLKEIENSNLSLTDVVRQIMEINHEAFIYRTIRESIKNRMQRFPINLTNPLHRATLRKELTEEMVAKRVTSAQIPEYIFQQVFRDLDQETTYLYNILPKMMTDPGSSLREQFLRESSLDRFYVEELEKEHFERKQMDIGTLSRIQGHA
jgi:uncharacterized protein (TIGR04442 family)